MSGLKLDLKLLAMAVFAFYLRSVNDKQCSALHVKATIRSRHIELTCNMLQTDLEVITNLLQNLFRTMVTFS